MLKQTEKFLKWRKDKLDFYQLELRHNKTPAEKKFHPFAAYLAATYKDNLRFQYIVRPNVKTAFIMDFYYLGHRINIELDGNTHNSVKDEKRDAILSKFGISVIRFKNEEIGNNFYQVREKLNLTFQSLDKHARLQLSQGDKCHLT